MNLSAPQMLALFHSIAISFIILFPLLAFTGKAIAKFGPEKWNLNNWSDSVVRTLAFIVFLTMVMTATFIVLFHWSNWFAILGPIEVFLFLIFIPLYKKME